VWAADNDALGGMTSASVVKMWKGIFLRNTQNLAHLQTLEKTFAPRFQIDALHRAKSVREWDIACLPLYGFESIEEMFRASDPVHVFRELNPTIPLVIINADDDWICPSSRLRTANEMYGSMDNVAIIETKGGGHLGWVDRLDVHKDRHYGRRRPVQIAYSLHSLFGSPTITHEAECTGGHAIWITNLTMQILDTTLSDSNFGA
jgi:predicted alpha/beta-fold hydrolase